MKICILIFLLVATFTVHAQNSDCITNPPDFSKLSYGEANAVVNSEKTKNVCPGYIANLASQLRRGDLSDDNKTVAIYFLGTLRPTDTNSIEILIENIDFRALKLDPKTDLRRWGQFPAEEALIKIGKPVIEPILEHLPKETSELRRQLMCNVLKQVLREK